jgi:ornithine decarboxylase
VTIARLNVGGGFPSHRLVEIQPQLEAIFARIDEAATEAFGAERPALVCEPGRGLCAEAFTLATRVKAIRDDAHVFLNDGVYGALMELPMIGVIDRIEAIAPDGTHRRAAPVARIVFGPTCDSVDRLPGEVSLPGDLAEEDYVVFHGMGAYSAATNTRFNGFGDLGLVTTLSLHS